MNHYIIHLQIKEFQRRILRFFGGLSIRDAEYSFAYRNVVGDGIKILDVGGCDSLLPITFAKQGFSVTEIDFRPYPEKHQNLKIIQGDFLSNKLPSKIFDFVVMVSTIEHIGFGSYGAPVYEDGDFKAIKEAQRVLKPSGRIIITFPFASYEHQIKGFERWYDLSRIQHLFKDMYILAEEYYVPHNRFLGKVVKWLPASLDQITSVDNVVLKYGYQCNACYLVSPIHRPNFN